MQSFMKIKPPKVMKSLCHLLMLVNHALYMSQMFNLANMSFYAFHKHKIIAKISDFTVLYSSMSP